MRERHMHLLLAFFLSIFLLAGADLVLAADVQQRSEIKVGDVLKLDFDGSQGGAINLRVDPEGFVSIPLIGQILVSGLTLQEVRDQIEARMHLMGIAPSAQPPGTPEPPIRPGDVLKVTIPGDAQQARQVLVRPDGTISFPVIGDLAAAGLTREELRQQIEARVKMIALGSLHQESERIEGKFKLGPGDVLDISVWGDEAMTRQVIIRPDGYISFPLVGEIVASGLTVDELRGEIESKVRLYSPDSPVTVTLMQLQSAMFYVTGKVARPGSYVMNGPTSVLQALAMAGGITPYASEGDILIVRHQPAGQETVEFDYKRVTSGKDLSTNFILKPGDTVVVP